MHLAIRGARPRSVTLMRNFLLAVATVLSVSSGALADSLSAQMTRLQTRYNEMRNPMAMVNRLVGRARPTMPFSLYRGGSSLIAIASKFGAGRRLVQTKGMFGRLLLQV